MTLWWLSSTRMTFGVQCDEQHIIKMAPPIARRFIGQHISKLDSWMRRQSGYILQALPTDDTETEDDSDKQRAL